MGDLVYLHRADLDDLPTGPPSRLERPTYRTDPRLDDWLGDHVDWTAETVGPRTRGADATRLPAAGRAPDQDRQAEGTVIVWPGGRR